MKQDNEMKQKIETKHAPQPAGAYSQGLRVGQTLYVAGQSPRHPETGEMAATIEAQTRQVLQNIAAILEAGGATLQQVVKVNVHLADLNDFQAFNRVYQEFFTEPYPVRTTVGSQLRNMMVEIDVIADLSI